MSEPRDPFAELFGPEDTPGTPPTVDGTLPPADAATPEVSAADLDALFGATTNAPGDELFGEAIASDVGAGALSETAAPRYGIGEANESGLDARGLLAEIDTSADVIDDLFGDAPVSAEVAAAIADPQKIVVRTVSAAERDVEKVVEEIAAAPVTPGRLARLWHWTIGWPARPHDPRYVLPRLARRLAVVAGLPLTAAFAIGLSVQGTLFLDSVSARFGMPWTTGFGSAQAATVPVVTIDGVAVEAGAAAEASRLTQAFWPAILAVGTGDQEPLRAISSDAFLAAYAEWLSDNGLAEGRFVGLDEQLSSGRGVLMSVDLAESPTRLVIAAPGGFASVVTPGASGPYYIASVRLTVVRLPDGSYRIDQAELL